jgi:hypothetical protein
MLSDTSPEAEKVQIELLRRATTSQRLGLALSLTSWAIEASKRAIARANPSFSAREVNLKFIEVHYGRELAENVRQYMDEMPR